MLKEGRKEGRKERRKEDRKGKKLGLATLCHYFLRKRLK
jgi:hypothetical protein